LTVLLRRCRSPYDLGRDGNLWAAGAYATLEHAIRMVAVDADTREAAVDAIQSAAERARARAVLAAMD
jgi:hypothetical protein